MRSRSSDRRQDPRADARVRCDLRGDLGQRRAVAQRARAHEVEPDVAVTQPEPVLPSEARRGLERVPGLAGTPPAAVGVDEPAERVDEAVEIGRDVESEDLDVVTDVADDRELSGLEDRVEASRETRTAASSGQQDDLHAGTARSARVRGPSTAASRRSRSTSKSTSSSSSGIAMVANGACARKRSALPEP